MPSSEAEAMFREFLDTLNNFECEYDYGTGKFNLRFDIPDSWKESEHREELMGMLEDYAQYFTEQTVDHSARMAAQAFDAAILGGNVDGEMSEILREFYPPRRVPIPANGVKFGFEDLEYVV